MSIRINREKCTGCTKCTRVCPGNLISIDGRVAKIKESDNCWGCSGCVKECPFKAIELCYEDEVGSASLVATSLSRKIEWDIMSRGEVINIITFKKQSNRY
ncbi:MAG: 4Fe-4S binding protein [Clostridium sp.]|uniref:indolepyruvate ferredoxin oxidoreductase subunit alpha n=1 Tax=Clostridium sp. TaxID=1506 RepID=UPI002FC902C3